MDNSNVLNNIEQIKILTAQSILELNETITKTTDDKEYLLRCRATLINIRDKLRHAEIYANLI